MEHAFKSIIKTATGRNAPYDEVTTLELESIIRLTLDDIDAIMFEYHQELELEQAVILNELNERIMQHFYGDPIDSTKQKA
jgi:hypothetical protein